ncbi:N-acetylglucosamine-6-phosphate deacetylase [Erysipelothrix inopinata]|uniref:N-acetylglucosamine-6-phosphate deacetylase n=1 Tax=Erysipelothrix inopinata TaxID=225084 RepID=A0A7G9S1B6_9FIRM|nr:N-acetylglucosamine-6-phosphate deacetylase [Erysipelothrix inopinata]QNN61641.1 N-acetylglucosamine-6-phosphate deacetylase [Erysipelothrix inopinata]
MIYYSKNIVTPRGVIEGFLKVSNGKIVGVSNECKEPFIDYTDEIILPGFIDVHVHGWGRGSYMFEKTPESIVLMAEDQAKEGVTGFLATTVTDSLEETYRYIEAANEIYGKPIHGSKFMGVHLEGPFMNKEHKGMQKEEYCINPDLSLMKSFVDLQVEPRMIKLMTIAPELDGSKEVIKYCKENGIQLSIGHSGATFDVISELKEYGLGGVTHMFSGMKGIHHRELGVVGTALYYDDLMCEFAKQTGMTVRHEAFDIVYRIKGADGIFMTTDCAGLANRREPSYHYVRKITFSREGNEFIMKHDSGEVERINIDDYSSLRTLEMGYIDSIKNMLRHTPMTYPELAKITSLNPARYIGMDDHKGKIQEGYDADLTIVTPHMTLCETVVEGERVVVVER